MDISPRPSRSSSTSSRNKANLTLDLSNLPPLILPTPPSNTLLFTNLDNLDIFLPKNIQVIRGLIENTVSVHSFTPLKSFRRIIISFYTVETAQAIRKVWDGEAVMGERVKVYFGQPTPINQNKADHLALPDAGKLFFISPPPSPPHGWEMRLEDAPNKLVHAEDLAEALAKLNSGKPEPVFDGPVTPTSAADGNRSRSSTLIYRPEDNGCSPDLPAVFVEDMTDEPEAMSPLDARPIMAHTARPPVELMMMD
ncbi:Putative Calcipressin-like protein [[Torrubiella] hemipterigena]|uniref:Putative Calcipressin-like protein n=1 Tax=[Torrubiella] hemipterigena TaxID=1531966 RepID=A0A0A1T9Y2_9HYPO|nr:Putative Calcipressin-like protein [[Torrubiella] hemipterigena]